eukprot:285936_1
MGCKFILVTFISTLMLTTMGVGLVDYGVEKPKHQVSQWKVKWHDGSKSKSFPNGWITVDPTTLGQEELFGFSREKEKFVGDKKVLLYLEKGKWSHYHYKTFVRNIIIILEKETTDTTKQPH